MNQAAVVVSCALHPTSAGRPLNRAAPPERCSAPHQLHHGYSPCSMGNLRIGCRAAAFNPSRRWVVWFFFALNAENRVEKGGEIADSSYPEKKSNHQPEGTLQAVWSGQQSEPDQKEPSAWKECSNAPKPFSAITAPGPTGPLPLEINPPRKKPPQSTSPAAPGRAPTQRGINQVGQDDGCNYVIISVYHRY